MKNEISLLSDMIFLLLVAIVPSVLLALPSALKERSWWCLLWAPFLSFLVVVLPLFVFFMSGALVPEFKDACDFGWLDCFISGKVAFAPVALFATAALYAVEILRVEKRSARWIIGGVWLGVMLAWTCFLYGLVVYWSRDFFLKVWLLVPFYIAVWYTVRAVQFYKAIHNSVFIFIFCSLPCWWLSWFLSVNAYQALPATNPGGCFVVTAAGRGHRSLVGPVFEITRNGRKRRANRQLLTFWELEARWQAHFPQGHARFRSVYNRIGPVIAARIKTSWQADAVFLALKPLEMVARWINSIRIN